MARYNSMSVAKVLACVLVGLMVVGIVGIIYKFTNGFNEDFKTFYIEYNGEQILTEHMTTEMPYGVSHRFDVKYTFDSNSAEPKDYSVKIVPNVTVDFDFYIGTNRYLYSKVSDFSSVFALKKSSTYFEITLPKDLTLVQAIQSVYGEEAEIPSDAETNNPYPYRLVVSSYNGKVTYNIDFRVVCGDVTGVTLSPDTIEFWEDEL